MPLFQIGYRRFEGERISPAMHWWPITRTGLSIAKRSKLFKRLVIFSFLPFIYFAFIFWIIGRITDPNIDPSDPFFGVASGMFGSRFVSQLHSNPELVRSAIWSAVFGTFGATAQLFLAGLMAAVVGPPLVANDLRSRAFLIYFARPLSRFDYVLGKTGILVAVLCSVTLIPSVALYVMSILFSPSIGTLVQTFPVLVSIVLANICTIVPAALIMLTLSSLTRQPRFATIAWFMLNLFGIVAHLALEQTRGLRDNGWTFLMSLGHTARALQLGIYDVQGRASHLNLNRDLRDVVEGLSPEYSAIHAGLWLLLVSVCCVFILLRRVDSPTRV